MTLPEFRKCLILITIGLVVCETACTETKQGRTPPEIRPAPPEPEASRNLNPFDQDSSQYTTFEGKAATDLRQHTTPSEGSDFDPDIDPSGKKLVYASTRHSPNSHLYIKSITGATITQITDGPVNDTQPEFGPDGKRIAFASDRAGNWDIWLVDANGRNPTQITYSPMPELHPSWSPDGKRLTYCRINTREDRGELWIAELEKPGLKRLIGEGLFPAWSPSGDKIAYQRARIWSSRWFSIWTLDIKGDEVLFPTEVASSPNTALISPAWSHDGTQLAFSFVESRERNNAGPTTEGTVAATQTTVHSDIGIVEADGHGLQRITNHMGESYAPVWSKDGRIYFSLRTTDSETIWSTKPLQPIKIDPPSTKTTTNRRAASVIEVSDEE